MVAAIENIVSCVLRAKQVRDLRLRTLFLQLGFPKLRTMAQVC